MLAGHGLCSRTRDTFSHPFKKKDYIHLTTYLKTYKIGDYVDVKVNGAIHKGMPHKFYHVALVGNRIIRKRIQVRIEHVQPSRCTDKLKLRRRQNDKLKAEAKACGEKISTKRQPGFMSEGATLETVTPIPYDVVNDLKGGC